MPWLRSLVKTGDSVMVTIPAIIVRRWTKAGVVAVNMELDGDSLVLTPQVLQNRRYTGVKFTPKEGAHGNPDDQS